MDPCHIFNLGLMNYLNAWQLQKRLSSEVSQGSRPNMLLFVEHPHVYTIGRRGNRKHIFLDEKQLACMGVSIHEVDRGGQVTYHGPGQLVAYPLVNLRIWGGPLKYVRTLEQVMVNALADFGVQAGCIKGFTGVWVNQRKIGAIGVKIAGGVSLHGFALNVNPDLHLYHHIVTCGVPNEEVTSMEQLIGETVDLETVAYAVQYHFGKLMGFRMIEEQGILE